MTATRRSVPSPTVDGSSQMCCLTARRVAGTAHAVSCWLQAKRKYQEVAQMRKELEQDNQELQQKYQQKALCGLLCLATNHRSGFIDTCYTSSL